MPKDKIFSRRNRRIEDFNFGGKTAAVFDDMLDRSVPFYAEIQRMIGEIAADFARPGTTVYDLGCSTGTTLVTLDRVLPPRVSLVGVDASPEMLHKCREKLQAYGVRRRFRLVRADLNKPVRIQNASVAVLNLTLQFVRPLNRARLIERVARGMKKGGCLLLVEKVLSRDPALNRFFINYYYGFKKRQGYSQLEISQKREALENVLIPYRLEENRELLMEGGFAQCDLFFKWYNFCGMVAVK